MTAHAEQPGSAGALTPYDDGSALAVVQHGTFAWASGQAPVLQDVCLRVARGQLVMVVGQVRCVIILFIFH